MKTINLLITGMTLIAATMSGSVAQAQQQYQLKEGSYSIKIDGTSNVHDWEMEAKKVAGKVVVRWASNTPADFKNVNITVPSKKLESGRRIMNNKTYDALEADEHPTIHFSLISVSDLESSGNTFTGTATGKMTIAGESNIMSIPFEGEVLEDNSFTVKGDFSMKMTEFGIDPPTAMLGSLKTGDKVKLNYSMTFNK